MARFLKLRAGYARRDVVIVWLASKLLGLASPKTRAMVQGGFNYGLSAAARDEAENREPPRPWQELLREGGRTDA